ncbi:MAG: hypothetical protein EOP04_31000 [Proteobacteria bacterium]|nr:MAG: hypothetical protein EOP04_31000 [Pseudomonadota bacterium]
MVIKTQETTEASGKIGTRLTGLDSDSSNSTISSVRSPKEARRWGFLISSGQFRDEREIVKAANSRFPKSDDPVYDLYIATRDEAKIKAKSSLAKFNDECPEVGEFFGRLQINGEV